jgi:hypothetical protein
MEVDHFNPTLKHTARNAYSNLYPAIRHCNGKKHANWPDAAMKKAGIRFLNPCEEFDYGSKIFEHPITHRLVGTTPAARYHIRVLDLNAPFLTHARKKRADLIRLRDEGCWDYLAESFNSPDALEAAQNFMEYIEEEIPPIPPPPIMYLDRSEDWPIGFFEPESTSVPLQGTSSDIARE